jgi:hypothetical protein
MKKSNTDIIPEQNTGAKTDVESSKEFKLTEETKAFFEVCKQRLLNINGWSKLSGIAGANFKLADKDGNEIEREVAQKGDYFKIDIPGPGPVTGDGYDWVQIEDIEDQTNNQGEYQVVAIRVRPATNPKNSKADVAHFFTNEATSSFIVERKGNVVTAGVHGRNEKPNTRAKAVVDKTRNVMVATGAFIGFSEAQWKSLVNGILGK